MSSPPTNVLALLDFGIHILKNELKIKLCLSLPVLLLINKNVCLYCITSVEMNVGVLIRSAEYEVFHLCLHTHTHTCIKSDKYSVALLFPNIRGGEEGYVH